MNRTRNEALNFAINNVVPYTKETVKVDVIDDEDDLGTYLTVTFDGITSSKYYYVITTDTLEYE